MALTYDEAVQVWAKNYAAQDKSFKHKDAYKYRVDVEVNEGYACCGGRDPQCYCSYAESPSAYIGITITDGSILVKQIELRYKDMAEVVREIIVAGGGTITA